MYSSDLWKSPQMFRWYSEIFVSVRVIIRSLWNCLGDLWKSAGVFRWSSEIFGRFHVAFDNLWKVNSLISLAETNCPIFSQIGQFLRFYSKSFWKLSKLNPKLDSFQKLKDNSCADNTGLTDCYIIKPAIIFYAVLYVINVTWNIRFNSNFPTSIPKLFKWECSQGSTVSQINYS